MRQARAIANITVSEHAVPGMRPERPIFFYCEGMAASLPIERVTKNMDRRVACDAKQCHSDLAGVKRKPRRNRPAAETVI